MANGDPKITAALEAKDWLKQQGVPTVLLFVLIGLACYALKYVVPQHIQMIREGYKEVAGENSKAVERVVEEHARDRELFVKMMTDERNSK